DLEAGARLEARDRALREPVEEFADRRQEALLLDRDRRISEPSRELERIDAVRVDDAVDVDVADVLLLGELRLHLLEGQVEDAFGLPPDLARAHLARGRPDVAREEFLVLEVHIDGVDDLLAVEEGAGRDLAPADVLLDLELLDLRGPGALVIL